MYDLTTDEIVDLLAEAFERLAWLENQHVAGGCHAHPNSSQEGSPVRDKDAHPHPGSNGRPGNPTKPHPIHRVCLARLEAKAAALKTARDTAKAAALALKASEEGSAADQEAADAAAALANAEYALADNKAKKFRAVCEAIGSLKQPEAEPAPEGAPEGAPAGV